MWKVKLTMICVIIFAAHRDKKVMGAEDKRMGQKQTITVGDMILTFNQYKYLYSDESFKRSGLARAFDHWPEATVPIRFVDVDDKKKELVQSAMNYISSLSCIKWNFTPDLDSNFVSVVNGPGCSSSVGNQNIGEQFVKLNDQCKWGNAVHELLHTLGFHHMHTTPERDEYVQIIHDNIQPAAAKNFDKYTVHVSMFDTKYDYQSIMHYTRNAFAIDDKRATIASFVPVEDMGQRNKMSDGDILRLKRMYNCQQLVEEEFSSSSNQEADHSSPLAAAEDEKPRNKTSSESDNDYDDKELDNQKLEDETNDEAERKREMQESVRKAKEKSAKLETQQKVTKPQVEQQQRMSKDRPRLQLLQQSQSDVPSIKNIVESLRRIVNMMVPLFQPICSLEEKISQYAFFMEMLVKK